MTDSFSMDFSEVDELVADLGTVASTAGQYVRKAVEVGARNVKDDWRDFARAELAGGSAGPFPASITYDVTTFQGFGASIIRAEIGPDKDRPQGALGNLLEFGSVNNAPKSYGANALKANESDFQRGLVAALEDAERVLKGSSSIRGSAAGVIRGRF